MQKILWKITYYERGLSKSLKKVNFIFPFEPSPLQWTIYQKQKEPGTCDLSLFRLQNKFRKMPLLIRYILLDQVWWCNIKRFLNYSKNYICKIMQDNSWHHKSFHFYLSFWIWKVWKGRWKSQKIWICREQKELFRWNKKHFS